MSEPRLLVRESYFQRVIRSVNGALRHATTSAFFVLLVIGLVARIAFIFSAGHHMDSDHAVVYLMAKHVAEGELASFYWGQSYGGTLLQLTAGLAMLAFGKTVEVLAITSVVLWAAAAVLLRLIVQHSVGRKAGDLAGVLFWFPGAVIFSGSTTDPGFYGPTLVLGLGGILLVLRQPTMRRRAVWVALGIFLGLSLWTSPMALAMVVPAAIVAAARDRNVPRWILGGSVAILAALPWIIETARSSLASVKPLGGAANLHPASFASMFTDMLPAAFPLSEYELVRFIVAVTAVVALALLLYLGFSHRNLGAILVGLGTVLVIVVLVLGSGTRLAGDSVRYSGFLLPALAFAAAWWVARFRLLSWVLIAAVTLITLVPLAQKSEFFTFSTQARFDPGLSAVADDLNSQGITAAYGDYWLAYAMTAATEERLTVAALVPRRYHGYEVAAANSSPMAIVVYPNHENDNLLRTRPDLPHFTRSVVGGYVVYEFDRWFDPYDLPLHLF